MKKKKISFILIPVFIFVIAVGFTFSKYYNSKIYDKSNFKKTAEEYEEKYLSTKSDIDLINLVYFLESSNILDERRIKYTPLLINQISEESISKSEMSEYYDSLTVDNPQTVPIAFYINDLLCYERYDLFSNEFVKYYLILSYNDQSLVSSVVLRSYTNLKNVKILDVLVEAYSKIAKQSRDELIINECLAQISSLRDAVKYVDGETVSIDNEILRSMTVDGEYIPITVKGKVIKYYSVTTGNYVDKIED